MRRLAPIALALALAACGRPAADSERFDIVAYERDKLSSPAMAGTRATFASLIRKHGYWCGEATAAAPYDGPIDENAYDVRVRCEGGGRVALYRLQLDPDTLALRVSRILD